MAYTHIRGYFHVNHLEVSSNPLEVHSPPINNVCVSFIESKLWLIKVPLVWHSWLGGRSGPNFWVPFSDISTDTDTQWCQGCVSHTDVISLNVAMQLTDFKTFLKQWSRWVSSEQWSSRLSRSSSWSPENHLITKLHKIFQWWKPSSLTQHQVTATSLRE